eukprot:TRINITY_DN21009_c0_g1_i1.p1 TRINITY_DN21009_c0_g1~~TRINITY_DN21009_c0_g1_i1.p1  ORF type:complete len:707 (-),score=142.54 TRINITY_DN21009_c0_g1_i1:13-2100(-)
MPISEAETDLLTMLQLPYVENAELEGTTLRLKLRGSAQEFTVILPEEYPQGEPVCLNDGNVLRQGRLAEIAAELHGSNSDTRLGAKGREPSTVSSMSDDPEEDEVSRSRSLADMCDQLRKDIAEMGALIRSVKEFQNVEDVVVEIMLDISFMDPMLALTWGTDLDQPIIIGLRFNRGHYLDTVEPPAVECRQVGEEHSTLASQIRYILVHQFRRLWRDGRFNPGNAACEWEESDEEDDDTETYKYVGGRKPVPQKETRRDRTKAKPKAGRGSPRAPKQPKADEKASIVEQLQAMGFDLNRSREAASTSKSFEEALDKILSGKVTAAPSAESDPVSKPLSPDQEQQAATLLEMGFGPLGLVTAAVRAARSVESAIQWIFSGGKDERAAVPSQDVAHYRGPSGERAWPAEVGGFLKQVHRYAQQRIPTCHHFCVICDRKHKFVDTILKPAVCLRELCVFAFRELNVGKGTASDVATPAYLHSLITLLAQARPDMAYLIDSAEARMSVMSQLPNKLEHGETWEIPIPETSALYNYVHKTREAIGKGGQANYFGSIVTKNLRLLILPQHTERFRKKQQELLQDGRPSDPCVAFHSTPHVDAMNGIVANNFDPEKCGRHDAGYYGRGTYFHTNVPHGGAGGANTFIALLLKGREYELTYRLGCPLQPGYDSHIAADRKATGETVIFKQNQMLPVFLYDSA